MTLMLVACLLGAGNLGETMVKLQWSSAIMRLCRVCVNGIVRISSSGVRVGFRIKMDSLILESIICGRANDTLMDHMPGNFSEDLKSHCIPNIGGYSNPPACFLLGRWEGLIRVEVENTFIESVFEEG